MGKKFSKVTTSHWGAFNVFVENDKIIKTEPFEADPAPPQISELVPKAVHHSKRIDQPYVRKGWIDKDPGSCLLYTSPSPRDKRQSRMPSSA